MKGRKGPNRSLAARPNELLAVGGVDGTLPGAEDERSVQVVLGGELEGIARHELKGK